MALAIATKHGSADLSMVFTLAPASNDKTVTVSAAWSALKYFCLHLQSARKEARLMAVSAMSESLVCSPCPEASTR
jgi:hypothetical protein